ncbi:MAG: phosphoribosyltransferase [Candidatus Thorarchaeota archaeon]|nr:MAG: phosphoribosyltransferase [Candidatus Thorarchaeota archaeon]
MMWSYRDRNHAGQVLAEELRRINIPGPSCLILAVPNGGVVVAEAVAQSLRADLDVIIVRKLQIPNNTEAGFGALTSFGNVILNDELVRSLRLDEKTIEHVIAKTRVQVSERQRAFSGLAGTSDPSGKDTILVDDGLASGYTMIAAVQSLTALSPASITVAVPTAHDTSVERVRPLVNHLVCPRIESGWSFAVAEAYEHWYDVPDSEVLEILNRFRR